MSTPENIVPTDLDVLSGPRNGVRFNTHPGNKMFKAILDSEKQKYNSITSKHVKSALIDSIVDRVHKAGGRFLGTNDSSVDGEWYVLTRRNTTDKIGHALRERNRKKQSANKKKQLQRQQKQQEQEEEEQGLRAAIAEPIHSWAEAAASFQKTEASLLDDDEDDMVLEDPAFFQTRMPTFNTSDTNTSCIIPPPPSFARIVSDEQEKKEARNMVDARHFAAATFFEKSSFQCVNKGGTLCVEEDMDGFTAPPPPAFVRHVTPEEVDDSILQLFGRGMKSKGTSAPVLESIQPIPLIQDDCGSLESGLANELLDVLGVSQC